MPYSVTVDSSSASSICTRSEGSVEDDVGATPLIDCGSDQSIYRPSNCVISVPFFAVDPAQPRLGADELARDWHVRRDAGGIALHVERGRVLVPGHGLDGGPPLCGVEPARGGELLGDLVPQVGREAGEIRFSHGCLVPEDRRVR
ncbi:hypothetical protein [Streptomyces sp. NPDC048527]|uniref:hypothetical protein n=1 Tax=Streptomyces sp. NPDC048527 TaxID=3365568 RepID=UPI003718FB62